MWYVSLSQATLYFRSLLKVMSPARETWHLSSPKGM